MQFTAYAAAGVATGALRWACMSQNRLAVAHPALLVLGT